MGTDLFQNHTSERGKFPILVVALTLALIVLALLGFAYLGRVPYGSRIELPPGLEDAIKKHFSIKERRSVKQMTVYNCSEFLDTFTGKPPVYATIVGLGDWQSGVKVDDTKRMLAQLFETVSLASAQPDDNMEWQIASIIIPGADYEKANEPKDSDIHPCSIKPKLLKE